MVKAARSPAVAKTHGPAAKSIQAAAAKPAAEDKAVPAAKRSTAKPASPKRAARTSAKSGAESAPAAARKPRTSAKAMPASRPAPKVAAAKPAATSKPPAKKMVGAVKKPTVGAAQACAPINLGFLSDFVGFHLRLAQDASYRAFARFKDKDLVKPGRFPALAIIHLNPGISQSALGRAIARDKSTVSPLIKDLQKNGLISRKPSPNDRRSVTLVLTKKGERVLDRLHARALEHEEDLDKVIGASKTRLVGMLDKITSSLAA